MVTVPKRPFWILRQRVLPLNMPLQPVYRVTYKVASFERQSARKGCAASPGHMRTVLPIWLCDLAESMIFWVSTGNGEAVQSLWQAPKAESECRFLRYWSKPLASLANSSPFDTQPLKHFLVCYQVDPEYMNVGCQFIMWTRLLIIECCLSYLAMKLAILSNNLLSSGNGIVREREMSSSAPPESLWLD